MTVVAEGLILHHGRELVVIPNEADLLEATVGGQESVRGTIIRFSALEQQRDKGLAVKHLPRLFHDDVIVVKT